MNKVRSQQDLAARILKVNHAGENGAVHIYTGQLFFARFTAPHMLNELIEFKSHEEKHRALFWNELQRRERPRCRSYWLCGLGGLVLGLVTGALGARAIAATTVAVERVVLRHLEQQLAQLHEIDEDAVRVIQAIVTEERQHHDLAASHLRPSQFWHRLLTPVVSACTETVIWVGMRV
ncbi:MAG: demethoxyubiquinone hydroxylase family protein [Burkholderiaceae bacterium]|nr:demethoxyubiquinone hydroxylase family protein [Burkholderiaceae bacterium]